MKRLTIKTNGADWTVRYGAKGFAKSSPAIVGDLPTVIDTDKQREAFSDLIRNLDAIPMGALKALYELIGRKTNSWIGCALPKEALE